MLQDSVWDTPPGSRTGVAVGHCAHRMPLGMPGKTSVHVRDGPDAATAPGGTETLAHAMGPGPAQGTAMVPSCRPCPAWRRSHRLR